MKSEKQTYEAFLRGANQAPSPLSAPAGGGEAPPVATAPGNQQQPAYPPVSTAAMATGVPSGKGGGGGVAGVGGM